MARAERPYQASLALVNRSLATPLREALPPLTEEIIAAIRASVPEYAQPLEGSFGRGVRTGVSEALTHVLKVDFWDVDEMANKIVAVLKYPPLSQTLRFHGSFDLRRLSWDGAAEKCERVYREALSGLAPRT